MEALRNQTHDHFFAEFCCRKWLPWTDRHLVDSAILYLPGNHGSVPPSGRWSKSPDDGNPKMEMRSHRGIKSGPWKNKTCDKAVVHHVINHRTRCQTIFSGSFVFVFLMFLQGAWQEGSANQRGWISMFELKQLWNMKYIAFRHISQRNQLEISLETSKHLETSCELGPWDHELCKSTKWFCFKGTTGCQARCHGHGPLWWMSLLGWLSSRISEWNYPLTLKTPSMGVKKHRSNLLTNIHHEWPLHINSHQFSNEKLQVDRCRRTSNELFHTVDAAEILREPVMSTTW